MAGGQDKVRLTLIRIFADGARPLTVYEIERDIPSEKIDEFTASLTTFVSGFFNEHDEDVE